MGQSYSFPESPAEHSPREISTSRRFGFKSVAIGSSLNDEDSEFHGEVTQGRDYTSDLPDELLASIFHFLGAGDRKRSSLVCHRWLRVDGQSRHRLSLNAQAGLLTFLPALFARFDSVTKLALRCDRKSISLDDDTLVLISIRCRNLTRLKLRGCREITDLGMTAFAQNCKGLKKLSCGSCMFGAKAMNAVLEHCPTLEELSVKRLRGVHDGSEPIGDKIASSSLKSITLREILNGQCFGPLIVGSKNLKNLKLIRCLGDWDTVLEKLENGNQSLIEVHLERLQVTDLGLSAISKCSNLEVLHIVKAPECSNFGLICVAENCKMLRKLHIDGWRTNRIGDEGLIAIAKECPNILELVLIGVNPTSLSLTAIASNCQKLERLALCGSGSIGDAEFACIAAKCVALKKLCIKGCPISDVGLEMLAWGCPSLAKIKVKKCRGVSGEVAEWLRERRGSLIVNWDAGDIGSMDASGYAGGAVQSDVEFPVDHGAVAIASASSNAPASSNTPMALFRTKFGFFSGRSFVPCTFRRWSVSQSSSSANL
ncbi:F-box protein SKIP2 [Malus sylvestris]|uniref:F-box protein SKIP2 n=1 Tax=Malus sylvestris TaxID=3752 RepID=UPI0021ACC2B5|nr:F-box protein SKIP2 [Malus sylvestris]